MSRIKVRLYLLILIIIPVAFYAYNAYVILYNEYTPFASDESFYYQSSRYFYFHSSLEAAISYNGEGARIFGSDVHGFAYPLVVGSIMKLFSYENAGVVLANLIFLIITITIIWFILEGSENKKLLYTISILISLNAILFTFTYVPENINLFFSVIVYLMITSIYTKKSKPKIVIFIIFLLVASLFRTTWVIYSFALLLLADSKRTFLKYLTLSMFMFSLGGVYSYFFMEPWVETLYKAIFRVQEGEYLHAIIGVGGNFAIQSFNLLFSLKEAPGYTHLIFRYLCLFAIVFFLVYGYKNKNRLLIGFGLATAIHLFVLLSIHGIHGWAVIRHLSPVYIFFTFYIIKHWEEKFVNYKYYFNLISLLLLLSAINSAYFVNSFWITKRLSLNKQNEYLKNKESLKNISELINVKSIIYINFVDHLGSTLSNLSVKNRTETPIKYIMRFYKNKLNPKIIDFVLCIPASNLKSNMEIDADNFVKIYEDNNYKFYKRYRY